MDSTAHFLRSRNFGPISRAQLWGAEKVHVYLPWVTPNMLCIFRMVGAVVLGALLTLAIFIGLTWWIVMLVIGIGAPAWLTDFIDGKLALIQKVVFGLQKMSLKDERALGLWRRILLKGETHLGDVIDPWADKMMFTFIGVPLSIIGDFREWMGGACFVELNLVLVRPFKEWFWGVSDAPANLFGKIKGNVQPYGLLLVLVTILTLHGTWIGAIFISVLMTLIITSQSLSLSAHLYTGYRASRGRAV